MNFGIIYLFHRLLNIFSDREKLEEIRKKTNNLEPISEEEYNLWIKLDPIIKKAFWKTYDAYMEVANASPEKKKEWEFMHQCFESALDELAKKDKRWRQGFFSKRGK